MTVNWASLLLGIVVGALVMWAVDWFFYGQANQRGYQRLEETQKRLQQMDEQVQLYQRKLENSDHLRQTADAELVTARATAKAAQFKLEQTEQALITCQQRLEEALNRLPASPASNQPDDLTQIKGIGPAYQQRLYSAGVRTLADLAKQSPTRLRAIINPPDWQTIETESWVAQAAELTQTRP